MDTISLLVEIEVLKEKIDNAEAFLEELIHYIFVVCKNDDYITPEVICRKLYKYGFIDKKDEGWVADTPQTACDNCAENGSYKCTKCDGEMYYRDVSHTDCDTCRHYKLDCELFSEICKYEPKADATQTDYGARIFAKDINILNKKRRR